MTYASSRQGFIEISDDIIDILGIHVGEEDGKKVALLKVALNPDKSYEPTDPDGLYFHSTNGINHQSFGPVAIADSQAALLAVPSVEEVTSDVQATDNTDEVPIVPPIGESGVI